jgi:hypothetical protein
MTTKDNGKKIKEIWLSGDGNVLNQRVQSEINGELELEATYHGDRDEFWVILKSMDEKEIERINCSYISKIVWL